MIPRLTLAALGTAAMFATAADAATFKVAEGFRDEVAGTTTVTDDGTGVLLGTIDTGDSLELYGRISAKEDTYNFTLSGAGAFNLGFLFGGFDLVGGGTSAASGLIAKTPPRDVQFSLLEVSSGGGGLGSVISTDDVTVTADITSGTSVLFANLDAGDYVLRVDGLDIVGNGTNYDLQIAAVPLPATALLLLAGVAGLGAAGRRRKG